MIRVRFRGSAIALALLSGGCRGDGPPGAGSPDASLGPDAASGGASNGGASGGTGANGGAPTSNGGADVGGANSGGATASGRSPGGGGTPNGDAGGVDAGGSAGDGGAAGSGAGGGAGQGGSCTSQVPCTPAECQLGATACDASGNSTCQHNGDVTAGTSCDMNRGVCNEGTCNPCESGADCTPNGSCQKMTIVCSSGTAVCTPAGNVTNGNSCGTNLYCNDGACAACTANASCVPDGKPCNTGIVSCSQGKVVCVDQGTPASNGTPCGTNQVCNAGACVACRANDVCTPANVCHVGHTSCDTGASVCVDTMQPQQNNTPCTGTNRCNQSYTCQNGTCTGSAPVTCAALDSCHMAGTCAQATGTCSNPTEPDTTPCGTNKACTGGVCQCASGYASCSGACVDLSKDKANCGACGHDCIGGKCSGGVCQRWLVGTDGGGSAGHVVADGTSVAWTDSSGVYVVPAAGTDNGNTPRSLSGTEAVGLALSNGRVVWLSDVAQGQTTLSVVPVSGGSVATSASQYTGGTGTSLTTDTVGTTAYFLDLGNQNPSFGVYACSPISALASCSKIASGTGQATSTAVGVPIGAYVFGTLSADWFYGAPSAVSRLSLFGAAGTSVGAATVQTMATDGQSIFWMNTTINSDLTTSFTIQKAPLTLGSSTTIGSAQSGIAVQTHMTADATNVYYSNTLAASFTLAPPMYIGYVPKTGGSPKTLYSSAEVISDVTNAGGAVYWLEQVNNDLTPSSSVYGQRFP